MGGCGRGEGGEWEDAVGERVESGRMREGSGWRVIVGGRGSGLEWEDEGGERVESAAPRFLLHCGHCCSDVCTNKLAARIPTRYLPYSM